MKNIFLDLDQFIKQGYAALSIFFLVFLVALIWRLLEVLKIKKAKKILTQIPFDTEELYKYVKKLFEGLIEANNTKNFLSIKKNLTKHLWTKIIEKNRTVFEGAPERWLYWPIHYKYEKFEIRKIDILGIHFDSLQKKLWISIEYNGLTEKNISEDRKNKIYYSYAVYELVFEKNSWLLNNINYYHRIIGFFKLLNIKNYYHK